MFEEKFFPNHFHHSAIVDNSRGLQSNEKIMSIHKTAVLST